MAKTTYSEAIDATTDVGFRAWATNLHNALIAVGLIQTSDTGQADFTTMVRPGANTWTLYRIYRYNDALQSTAPVFLRVDYGQFVTNGPGIRLGVGRATDGAGNLTVAAIQSSAFASQSQVAAVVGNTSRTWVGLKDGAFTLLWACDSTGLGGPFRIYFSLDRSRDGAGAATDECVYVTWGPSSWAQNMFLHGWVGLKTGQSTQGAITNVSCWVPGNAGATTFASKVQAFKHFTLPQQMRTHLNPLTVVGSEIGTLAVIDLEIFGTTHQYISPGPYMVGGFATGFCTSGSGSNNNANPALKGLYLWEDG